MKKIFVLWMVLILFISACGKADINSDSSSQINDDSKTESIIASIERERLNEIKEILSKVSKRKISKLINETYSEKYIFEKSFLYRLFNPVNGYNPTMDMFDECFGIKVECVRKMDKENYYCVFETKENGYVYCFFRYDSSYLMLYNSCYVKESLTKSQFDNLKVGDTIESVIKIDTSVLSRYDYCNSLGLSLTQSVHLLKDGLLIIEYENDVIKSIDFNDDFIYFENGIEYSYKILKKDYPQ